LGERSTGAEEKRRVILDAAVRVFAHKGFHTSRVGDIAEEAGVAHGLLYHYFSSKDEVLETIFRETWGELLADLQEIEDSGAPAREQLKQATLRLLGSWQRHPDVVRVIVREIARSPGLQGRIGDLVKPVEAVQRIIAYGQETGEFRSDFNPRLAGVVYYGGIEELLSGWALGLIADSDEVVAAAEQTLLDIGLAGFTAAPEPAAPLVAETP
jgi:TetR/AcrR family transcriptional regulator, fatty acid metabolism regulator protein